jgi:hypothetical protein
MTDTSDVGDEKSKGNGGSTASPIAPLAVAGNVPTDPPSAGPGLSTPILPIPQSPPLPPGSMPGIAGAAMLGITLGQPQQNPAVMQHICQFLSHDSDNRLKSYESRGHRTHTFRLAALAVFTLVAVMILSIPLVALWRGDMMFVKEFLDHYFQMIIIIVLALLGGGKLFEIFK